MITLFKAIDRDGRTLATVETGDREAGVRQATRAGH